ncbi:hypothetical protein JCM19233_5549 [Vibrio astriarenae]|nr:hypothetical protein JCM19233_5549 [Vibrio sp. C7]
MYWEVFIQDELGGRDKLPDEDYYNELKSYVDGDMVGP